ncbi:hypothetical protein KEM52_003539 [Ascosphaera acerosa]|nr:hypothetical protein KEM52_003539 [Ascosphaera acerosa]
MALSGELAATMPARHPRAAFEPISPDFDLRELIDSSPNFREVVRIPCEAIDQQGVDAFERLVRLHVIQEGKPLVIEGYDRKLDTTQFSAEWLDQHYGQKVENATNLSKGVPITLTISHYLKNMHRLARETTPETYRDPTLQRVYLKDIDCPPEWQQIVTNALPSFVTYFDEGTKDEGDGTTSVAGDLMSSLPESMRAANIMCYIGHEGTYTPAHREMCATLGQNIMVEASGAQDADGKPTIPGSSLWFMTESGERPQVAEFFRNMLGHDVETERHFAQLNAWKAAPFTVWAVEQRVGDLILIPPLAPHQVWNRGTRTMKVAWNRTTVETLELALKEALANARLVCRDEQYQCKAIVYFTLLKYSSLLRKADAAWISGPLNPKVKQMRKDFRRLFSLFTEVLLSESFSRTAPAPKNIEFTKFESEVTCSYCRCNIFNRFLTCKNCISVSDDGNDVPYDVCLECYALGRSCWCISSLTWCEQFHWADLLKKHEDWRRQISGFGKNRKGHSIELPSFKELREQQTRRTLAEICQLQLKQRPFNGKGRPLSNKELDGEAFNDDGDSDADEDVDDDVDDDGRPRRKRRKVRRRKPRGSGLKNCHICKKLEPSWRLASCGDCNASYCYGSLFRAFEIYPPEVMDEFKWKCPRCMKICSCGACRRNPSMKPFEPTVTYLGHKTLDYADPRSVELLVDFSVSNVAWLKKANNLEETEGFPVLPFTSSRLDEPNGGVDGLVREAEPVILTTEPGENNENGDEDGNDGSRGATPVDPSIVSSQQAVAIATEASKLTDVQHSIASLAQLDANGGEHDDATIAQVLQAATAELAAAEKSSHSESVATAT